MSEWSIQQVKTRIFLKQEPTVFVCLCYKNDLDDHRKAWETSRCLLQSDFCNFIALRSMQKFLFELKWSKQWCVVKGSTYRLCLDS